MKINRLRLILSEFSMSTEAEAIETHRTIYEISKSLGLPDDNLVMSEINAILNNFDVKARSIENIVFATREESTSAKQDYITCEVICKNIDFNNEDSIQENLKKIEDIKNESDVKTSYCYYVKLKLRALQITNIFSKILIPKHLCQLLIELENYKQKILLSSLLTQLEDDIYLNALKNRAFYLSSLEYKQRYELAFKYQNREKSTIKSFLVYLVAIVLVYFAISFVVGLFTGFGSVVAFIFCFIAIIAQMKERTDIRGKGKVFWNQLTKGANVDKLDSYE